MVNSKKLITKALLANASSKTRRYFVDANKSELNRLVNTVERIRDLGKNKPLDINGALYYAEDYKLPQILVDYINTKHLSFNTEAIGMGAYMDDYVDRTIVLDGMTGDSDIEEMFDEGETNCLSPVQTEAFFRKYNENQTSEGSIETVDVKFTHLAFSDFKELSWVKKVKDDNGNETEVTQIVNWSTAGSKKTILALLGGIIAPVDAKYLDVSGAPTFEEAAAWIFRKSAETK